MEILDIVSASVNDDTIAYYEKLVLSIHLGCRQWSTLLQMVIMQANVAGADKAGNNTQAPTALPLLLDTSAPTVTLTDTDSDNGFYL